MSDHHHDPQHDYQENVEKPPPWLISFGDVTALMLTFFVMLFAMSEIPSEKWDNIVSVINTSEKPLTQTTPIPTAEKNVQTVRLDQALSLDYLRNIMEQKLQADPVLKAAVIHQLDERVVVSMPSNTLFPAGSDALTPGAQQALFRIGGTLAGIGNRIVVQGHTGPDEKISDRYGSDWGLSLARAVAVANKLREIGYSRHISILGLGASRYAYLDPAIPESQRNLLARRVDIVIYPTVGDR